MWQLNLQTQCSLSTTEVSYIVLSQYLWEVIPIINLLEELKSNNIDTVSNTATVFLQSIRR